ncbi:proline-rich transmembrane protein 4 [Carettochelys insculpta]|uniref:proline-rich transmembrane protein 4 n=1 Tax=Carettochelys insculpta TaxID=44489 RepID=UPI003EB781FF
MWAVLALLWLALPGSSATRALAEPHQSPPPAGTSTPGTPPQTARAEDPLLSLNLGLNFKIQVLGQGRFHPAGPSPEPTLAGLPPADTARPALAAHLRTPPSRIQSQLPPGEALAGSSSVPGSGWLGSGSADEPSLDAAHGPGGWGEPGAEGDGSPAPRFHSSPGGRPAGTPPFKPDLLQPVSTARIPWLWPLLGAAPPASGQPTPASAPRGHSKGLAFKINIDLTAGLDQEEGAPPTHVLLARGGQGPGPRRKYLKAGISEIASKLGTAGRFGPSPPPDQQQERNSTGGVREQPQEPGSPLPPAMEPGPDPGRPGPSPGSEGVLAAWPMCTLEKPEECGSPSPEPDAPPVPRLLPSLPLFVALHADWNTALASWGLAWEAHVYGAGCLFGLLALLSLLSLAGLPCRCPPGCTLLAALELLLLAAGAARAFLLCYDAYGQQERLPALATLLLDDLPFPCLSSALALAFLLLARRSHRRLSHARGRPPACLAALVLLHFCLAVGAVLAADLLHQFPFLLLVSRGAFALLAALLSLAFLAFYGLGWGSTAQPYGPKSSPLPGQRLARCPLAEACDWSRAARTTLPAACFALLSAVLQAYTILHALGYGLPPACFGPWPWWALQLGCRLCEAGTGLPLALLGLYPLCSSHEKPCLPCWGALLHLPRGPSKATILPGSFQWAVVPHEKLVMCDTIARSDAEFLPLYALAGSTDGGCSGTRSPGAAWASETCLKGGYGSGASSVISIAQDGDPTMDFRPPSPINLRRSIDEALCSEALIPGSLFGAGGALAGTSALACSLHEGLPEVPASRGLYRTSSCGELLPVPPEGGEGHGSPEASAPDTTLSSPGCSPYRLPQASSSLALCPSPETSTPTSSLAYEQKLPRGESNPRRSPPPPGGPYLPLVQSSQESLNCLVPQPPAGDTAELQEEFLDVCRQIDTLSVSSDTIDL